MLEQGSSENHQMNNLRVIIDFAKYLGHNTFLDINKREEIISYLNGKIKDPRLDPDKRWITTWNHYSNRIKLFYRWIYNYHLRSEQLGTKDVDVDDWITPDFVKIKQK
jgi:hypothetical protein